MPDDPHEQATAQAHRPPEPDEQGLIPDGTEGVDQTAAPLDEDQPVGNGDQVTRSNPANENEPTPDGDAG